MEYLLAHDVGTSGCKAALLTTDGCVVAKAFEPYPLYYPQPLWAEQNLEDMWRAVTIATHRVMEVSKTKPEEVLSLSFSTQMVNTVALDRQGSPLRPMISWLDGRAWKEADLMMRKIGGPTIFAAVVGTALTGKDVLPKYLWLKANEPQVYEKAAAFVDVSGYLLFCATGKMACEWSVASVTGLFNVKTKAWDTGVMSLFGIDKSKFPELVRSIDKVGGLTAQAAAQLGLPEGLPVFGGVGDAQASAIGTGAVCEGDAHISLGTSGYVGIVSARRVSGKQGLVSIQSGDPDKLLLIGETETAGQCLKWAAKELYGMEPDGAALHIMDDEIEQAGPGSGGLLFTPWMYGERCPVADDSLRAAFINLGSNHSRVQMARAVYEGVAYNFRWILDMIRDLYHFPAGTLRITGGGAKGLPWLRIMSDVTGCKLESVPNPQETTAVGAAMAAAIGLGIYPSFDAIKPIMPVEHVFTPESEHKATYDRFYSAYRQVYPSLKKLYHTLNHVEKKPVNGSKG